MRHRDVQYDEIVALSIRIQDRRLVNTVQLRARRNPQQARSRRMRDDILEAAIRVLRRDGALKFTTWRVAEVAGVSVGSLYQYFPNKQSIIYAIHSAKVGRTWVQVQRILDSPTLSARQKVRRIARVFFLVESSEVIELGASLHEAEIYFASQPRRPPKLPHP